MNKLLLVLKSTGYTDGDEWLVAISWDEDHLQSILFKVKRIVESNEKGPERYIHLAYGNYKAILEKPFGDSFEDTREANWEEHEKVILY